MPADKRRHYYFKGRVALYALLEAAGIGGGDLVVIPGYTCIVVPFAIRYRGAQPLYVDIDPTTYNLDPAALRDTLDTHPDRSRIRAVVAQHTYGIPCEMNSVLELAHERNLLVIEDACHALGSRYRGRETGTFGAAAFYSSQWSKPLTTGLGGWAVVNDPDLEKNLVDRYANYPAPPASDAMRLDVQKRIYDLVYRPSLAGAVQEIYRRVSRAGLTIGSSTEDELAGMMPADYKLRMGKPQRKRLEVLLARADANIAGRRSVAMEIEGALRAADLPILDLPDHLDSVLLRYPVSVSDKAGVLAAARERRVELGDWFLSPVHPNMASWEIVDYERGSCPNAEAACTNTINMPTHDRFDTKAIGQAITLLSDFRR